MRNSVFTSTMAGVCLLATSPAQLENAGTLLVDLDASTFTTGDGTWVNAGTLGDFTSNGDPQRLDNIGGSTGNAIYLDGSGDFFQQVGGAPASITGAGDRSIEAWVWNPSIAGEETVASWGHRGGPDGTNFSANYGNDGTWGALGGWGGAADQGWGGTVPPEQSWHHLAWTYDSATNTRSVYVDGALSNSENDAIPGTGTLNTHTGPGILIGAQWANATTVEGGLQGSLAVGRVRVHDGVLNASQVSNNFAELANDFVDAPPPPAPSPVALSSDPIHRYSFDEIGGSGTVLVDSIGNADGSIVEGGLNDGSVGIITSGQVTLSGGPQAESDWIQMPGGLVSGNTDMTIELWSTQHDVRVWSRVFSVGDNPDDVMHMAFTAGGDLNANELRWNDNPANGQINNFGSVPPNPLDQEVHWVVTVDDDGGLLGDTLVTVYQDGAEVGSFETTSNLADINDTEFFLGRSQWPDETANASWNELRIYDYPLDPNEVLGNNLAGPDLLGIPEPGAASLIGLLGLGLLLRRRRS